MRVMPRRLAPSSRYVLCEGKMAICVLYAHESLTVPAPPRPPPMQSKFESKVTGVEWVGADDLVRVFVCLSAHSAVVLCLPRAWLRIYTAPAAKRHGTACDFAQRQQQQVHVHAPFSFGDARCAARAAHAALQPTTPTDQQWQPTNTTERLRRHAAEPHLALQGRRLQL